MKKILSIILVLCFIFSMNVCAFAQETGDTNTGSEDTNTSDTNTGGEPGTNTGSETGGTNTGGETGGTNTGSETGTTPPDEIPDGANYVPATDAIQAEVITDDDLPTEGTNALQQAVTNAEKGGLVVVETEKDVGGAKINKEIAIDVMDNDVLISKPSVGSFGTETIGLQVLEESEKVSIQGEGGSITFDGGSFDESVVYPSTNKAELNKALADAEGNPMLKRGVQNYADLSVENVTIDGRDLANTNGYTGEDGLVHQDPDPEYENIVIAVANGSLTVGVKADILAAEGDVAIAVSAYTDGLYTDGPTLKVEDGAGTIQGTIVFDGDDDCAKKLKSEMGIDIQGGTFNNFLLRIGEAVKDYVDNINIGGGIFDSKNVEYVKDGIVDTTTYKFEQFLEAGHVVVEQNGKFVVMTQAEADSLKAPVVAVIGTPVYTPAATQVESKVEVDGQEVAVKLSSSTVASRPVKPVKLADEAPAVLEVVVDRGSINANKNKADAVIEVMTEDLIVKGADGETLDAADYEVEYDNYGRIKIKLSPELLEDLGAGKHVFTVIFGGVEVQFKVIIH